MDNIISTIQNILTTREQATLIWILVVLILFYVFSKRIRKISNKAMDSIEKTLFRKKFLIWLGSIISSILLSSILLYIILNNFDIWDTYLIKIIIGWTIVSGIILSFEANSIFKNKQNLQSILLKNVTLLAWATSLIIFVFNLHPFNLWIELIIVPLGVFLMIFEIVARKQHLVIHKIVVIIIAVLTTLIFSFSLYKLIVDYTTILTTNNIVQFFVPTLSTILYLPFLYLMALFMSYEKLFIDFNNLIYKPSKVPLSVKIAIIKICHIRFNRVETFVNDLLLKVRLESKQEALEYLKSVRYNKNSLQEKSKG